MIVFIKFSKIFLIVMLAGTIFSPVSFAAKPATLKWPDLLPKLKRLNNPVEKLTGKQLGDFGHIDYWLGFESGQMDKESLVNRKKAKAAAEKSKRKLTKQGIDVDKLFDGYYKWLDEIDRRRKLTVNKYNGKQISIAGYLLPLDFSDAGVKEFLLVPYVGACIHSPPPPENQMVFVRLKKAHAITGLYDPVMVTGSMNAKRLSKELTLVDGSNKLDIGYTINGGKVSEYKRPQR